MVAKNRYIGGGKSRFVVYSGLTLLDQFAVSSQVPNIIEIVTNKETTRKRIVVIDGVKFIVRKSRFEITKDNYAYYTTLQLFSELSSSSLEAFAKQRVKEYLNDNNIDSKTLIRYAMYFPARVMKNLMGSGVLEEAL